MFDGAYTETLENAVAFDCGSFNDSSTQYASISPQRVFVSSDDVITVGWVTNGDVAGRGVVIDYSVGEQQTPPLDAYI